MLHQPFPTTGALRQNKDLVDFSLAPVSVSYETAYSFLRFQMRFVARSISRMFGVDRDQMVLPAKPSNVMELLDLWPPPPSSKAVIISVSIDTEIESRVSDEPDKPC